MNTVYIGADHAGFKLKQELKKFLDQQGYKVMDVGAFELDPADDYPVYAYKVAKEVSKGKGLGILVCGSAEGVCIAANKVKGVRAVAVWTLRNARLSREHNDANVLCLSGWELSLNHAKKIVKLWLSTGFSGEERHKRRLEQIKRIENGKKP
ncbi:MAG: RpiB/LacA/LacB family sugar-phosphate isomerase [Candidatus Woesearchaeota archaeon]